MGQFPSYLSRYRHSKTLNNLKFWNVWTSLHNSLWCVEFLIGCISFNIGTINTKLQDFVKLGELFKIKYRLVLRLASYEIWQCFKFHLLWVECAWTHILPSTTFLWCHFTLPTHEHKQNRPQVWALMFLDKGCSASPSTKTTSKLPKLRHWVN